MWNPRVRAAPREEHEDRDVGIKRWRQKKKKPFGNEGWIQEEEEEGDRGRSFLLSIPPPRPPCQSGMRRIYEGGGGGVVMEGAMAIVIPHHETAHAERKRKERSGSRTRYINIAALQLSST